LNAPGQPGWVWLWMAPRCAAVFGRRCSLAAQTAELFCVVIGAVLMRSIDD